MFKRLQDTFRAVTGRRRALKDIGWDSFRGGIHFINYFGDRQRESAYGLGIEKELGNVVYEKKRPELLVSDSFSKKPQFSFAQSLFTHLMLKISVYA
jgi:hypothetical protein